MMARDLGRLERKVWVTLLGKQPNWAHWLGQQLRPVSWLKVRRI